MRSVKVCSGEGVYVIEASGFMIGEELVLSVWGGTRPHVGAVAVAVPRPSLADPRTLSSTASVYTLVGHKDDVVAKRIAEKVSAGLNTVVVVTVGIHIDGIDAEGIERFVKNCDDVAEKIIAALAG